MIRAPVGAERNIKNAAAEKSKAYESSGRSRVEKAFVESYKQLKKYQKEEADILIRDILSGQRTL